MLKTFILFCVGYSNLMFAKESSKAIVEIRKPDISSLELMVKPHKDYEINEEGPWELAVITTQKTFSFRKERFDKKIPGFLLSSKQVVAGSKYKVTAFLCSKQKNMCHREVFEGFF